MPINNTDPNIETFRPAMTASYTAEQLAAFIKKGQVTLATISKLRHLSLFSLDELMQFITSQACTMAELQATRQLQADTLKRLTERIAMWNIELSFWQQAEQTGTIEAYREYQKAFPHGTMYEQAAQKIIELTEAEIWVKARQSNTISLYEHYLSAYPDGTYHIEAESAIREIKERMAAIKSEIFADMRTNPLKYTPHVMRALLRGTQECDPDKLSVLDNSDVAAKFINMGCTLSHAEMVSEGIIPGGPNGITEVDLMTEEFQVPQTNSLDDFPQDRTDIYFMGVPRSGKSSVLAALFNTMTRVGNWEYVPNINEQGRDNSMAYYNGLIRSIANKKPPVPTALETINYINIDVPHAAGTRNTAHLNFVEISGECFKNLADAFGDSRDVWLNLGASRVIANDNRKVVFFLLDYNTILGNQRGITQADQEQTLTNALTILSHDGPNHKNPQKGCTMSKVESVGVIMTKADLMPVSDMNQRLEIAQKYLKDNFSGFMNNLMKICNQFGINKAQNFCPYIFTFSLGDFYPGNTMLFNQEHAMQLASHIEHLVPTKRSFNPFA